MFGSNRCRFGSWPRRFTRVFPDACRSACDRKMDRTAKRLCKPLGCVAPALTGFLVDRTGKFPVSLAITAAVLVARFLSWVFVVGSVEQVNWKSDQRSATA